MYVYTHTHTQNTWTWSPLCLQMSPDSKVHGANMGPTWVLSAPDGPHVGPTNLGIRVLTLNGARTSADNPYLPKERITSTACGIYLLKKHTKLKCISCFLHTNQHIKGLRITLGSVSQDGPVSPEAVWPGHPNQSCLFRFGKKSYSNEGLLASLTLHSLELFEEIQNCICIIHHFTTLKMVEVLNSPFCGKHGYVFIT